LGTPGKRSTKLQLACGSAFHFTRRRIFASHEGRQSCGAVAQALSVGFAIGIYGLIGIKYVLAALNKYAAIIVNERGKIVLSCLWFLVLSGPVLFGGVWLFLQPFPKTTWYGRLIYVVVAIGLVIAGFREAVSIGSHAARDTSTAT
jgi:hypothetical protein